MLFSKYCFLPTTVGSGLDHVAQTITANITALLVEDPDCGPDNIINCGSSLLNWFCRLNWIGPFQLDLACPYINTKTLVCLKSPLMLFNWRLHCSIVSGIIFLLNSYSVNSIQRVLRLSPGMVRYVGMSSSHSLLHYYVYTCLVQILLAILYVYVRCLSYILGSLYPSKRGHIPDFFSSHLAGSVPSVSSSSTALLGSHSASRELDITGKESCE